MKKLNRKYEIDFLCKIILKIFNRLEEASIVFFGEKEDIELIKTVKQIQALNNFHSCKS